MTVLFSGADLNVALRNVQGNAETEVSNFSDDYVLAHPIEELVKSVFDKYAVKAPKLDKDAITSDWVDGYTTWRDTRTALIIFSRNQDFTNVVNEAQRAMKDHPHFKSGPQKEAETKFRYVFTHPGDKQRDIIVTLMLFNMPKPVKP
jgi:hypothetical protein